MRQSWFSSNACPHVLAILDLHELGLALGISAGRCDHLGHIHIDPGLLAKPLVLDEIVISLDVVLVINTRDRGRVALVVAA